MTDSKAYELPAAARAAASEAILNVDALEVIPGVRVLAVHGELDLLTRPTLARHVRQELAAGPRGLVLDLSDVSFLGSSGISVLVETRDSAFRANVPLRLVGGTREVLRPLEATGVVELFGISATLTDALRYHDVDSG